MLKYLKNNINNIIKWLNGLNIKFRPRKKKQCRNYDEEQFKRIIRMQKMMLDMIDDLFEYEQNPTSEIKKNLNYYLEHEEFCWFIEYIMDKKDK